jgi:hypothetical protein
MEASVIRAVPVPEVAKRFRPWAFPKVFAPPDGDLTNDQIAPAELLVDPQGPFGVCLRIYATVDADDVAALAAGGFVEITLHTGMLPVFSLDVISEGQ